ncbi:MAG: prepilin-type N-terminal cleavage/methylation domain-containing protein [bacterium]|nr:prepilin-type N-terminal cleavage/methylation domain-containing protein [bacterium]
MKHNSQGFTLIELIISISILALASAVLGAMQIKSIALASENHLTIRSMAYASEEAEKLYETGFEGSAGTISLIQKNEETGEETGFSCSASTSEASYSLIPAREIYVSGKNGGREYARYKTFKIQGL